MINRLIEFGDRRAALIEARKGRALFPTDTRFDTMVRSMAQEALKEATEESTEAPVDEADAAK